LEILALLLLGFIALLIILPPVIRGKLNSSPLASTRSFQRSMQEMASSIEPYGREEKLRARDRAAGRKARRSLWHASLPQAKRRGRHARQISRSEMRRRRLLTMLTLATVIWAVAALASRQLWCLVVFAVAAFLSLTYLALCVLITRVAPAGAAHRHIHEIPAPPKRQAM
jgi:hypothetical protein